MDLTTLQNELQDLRDLRVETLSEDATLSVVPAEQFMIVRDGTDQYMLNGAVYANTLKYIGMAKSMATRLKSSTASAVATELMQSKGRATALLRDTELMAIVPKGRYKSLPVDVVLDTIEETLGDVECNRVTLGSRYGARLELLGEREHEVIKGDLVQSGVMIDFNPVGLTDPIVQSYGLRLVCTNGMTANTVLETYVMTPDVTETQTWLRDAITNAYEGLDDAVIKWRDMAGFPVTPEDRALLLGGFIRDARLKATEQATLLSRATEEPPETAYDVFNLMTWFNSHVLTDPRRLARAQATAARFAQDNIYHRNCPTCHRAGH